MKKILLSIAAASALVAAAAPALAADYGDWRDRDGYADRFDRDHDGGIDMRQARIERRIDWGIRTGQLNRREAWSLQSQARDLARLEARYRYDGLNGFERADLNRRLDDLSFRVDREMHDGDRYGDGYGRRW